MKIKWDDPPPPNCENSHFFFFHFTLTLLKALFKGVLISGGAPAPCGRGCTRCSGPGCRQDVELYNLVTKTSCNLPDMNDIRAYHTSVDGVICGGSGNAYKCIEYDGSNGSWNQTKYAKLPYRYQYQTSWNINSESFMLLGK